MKTILLPQKIILFTFFLTSCSTSQTDFFTADIRSGLNNISTLNLSNEIENVTYVQLEVNDDDASLISGVSEFVVTDKYIYIYPTKEPRIVLFDRSGRFLKTLINYGQGPGEFSGTLVSMQADEKNNRLYLFCTERTLEYTLEGEFIRSINHNYQVIFQHQINEGLFAAVALPFIPFQGGSFGIGIFTENGDTIAMRNDFYSSLVPRDKSGFTLGLTPPAYSKQLNSVLFKTGSCDTIFRISEGKIQSACVLNLKNSENEIIRSLDVTDFSSLISGTFEKDGDIYISDMFETTNQFYLRFRYNQSHYTSSIDKITGKTLVEKCEQPEDIKILADANLMLGMIGTKSHKNFPVWGRMEGDNLVQVVTSYELNIFKNIRSIDIPEILSTEEENNPVFIFYKIKK